MVTITDTRVTGDLHDATVFYTVLGDRVDAGELVQLAASALLVLSAETLYLLDDTGVLTHHFAVPLAGIAMDAVMIAQVSTQSTFLAYGTTARASRLHGAGRRVDAV